MTNIANSRILILATDGFEDPELYSPRLALLDASAKVTLASPHHEPIRGCIYNGETVSAVSKPKLPLQKRRHVSPHA